jgi:hypothetical protein
MGSSTVVFATEASRVQPSTAEGTACVRAGVRRGEDGRARAGRIERQAVRPPVRFDGGPSRPLAVGKVRRVAGERGGSIAAQLGRAPARVGPGASWAATLHLGRLVLLCRDAARTRARASGRRCFALPCACSQSCTEQQAQGKASRSAAGQFVVVLAHDACRPSNSTFGLATTSEPLAPPPKKRPTMAPSRTFSILLGMVSRRSCGQFRRHGRAPNARQSRH